MTATVDTSVSVHAPRTSAPLPRLLGSELRWVLRRPRTWVVLLVVAMVPVLIGIGLASFDDSGGGPGLIAAAAGNWMVLPIAGMAVALPLLLPLMTSMAAADALAGESNHGTLRSLLLAPVGRLRLLGVKAFGVLAVSAIGVALMCITGLLSGVLLLGGGELLSLSGTTLGIGDGLLRVLLAAGWVLLQLAAIGAVALAISSATSHPLVVLAATLGVMIGMTVIGALPGMDWLQPALLTTGFGDLTAVLRDPLPWSAFGDSTLRAASYVVIGISAAAARMVTKDS